MNDNATNDTSTILVVDGDVLVSLTIAEYLRGCGFVVLEASSGDEALAVLQSGRTVDALLSDLVLPGAIDGFVLSTWVRDNRPGTKTILTASAASVASSAARLCNSDGPLPKPYEPGRVLERIHRLPGRAAGQSGR